MQAAKTRVAAYCRVSTDHTDQANSFAGQQRYFRRYIAANPAWTLYEIFADEGLSGTSTKHRRAFQRMIDCALGGEIDLIVTKEISRFARNTLDSIYYTRMLKKHGVGVVFVSDGINTLDGDAELRLAILSSIAQEESRRTSERVKWGQRRQMEQGVVFGRSMLGYDVRGGRMYVDPAGARVVRAIFRKFVVEGKGAHTIARELQEEGVRPMRAAAWHSTVILRMLRNEKYCGDLVQKKTYTPDYLTHEKKYNRGQEDFVTLRNHHEPIVSRAMFEAAGRILDEKARSQIGKPKHSRRDPFSGKIRCGRCGAGYAMRCKTRRDGSRYRAWRCGAAARHDHPAVCTEESIRHADAVYLMRQVCRSLHLAQSGAVRRLCGVIRAALTDAQPTRGTALARLEQRRQRLAELYADGAIDRDWFAARRAQCDAEQARLCALPDDGAASDAVMAELEAALEAIAAGETEDEVFYACLLDKMVVETRDRITVRLRGAAAEWRFAAAEPTAGRISDASVPISVSMPLHSL